MCGEAGFQMDFFLFLTNICINLNLNSMVPCLISWGHLSIRKKISRFPLPFLLQIGYTGIWTSSV